MRGFLKKHRQRRTVAAHLGQYGGFCFRGQPVAVPDHICLKIKALIANGSYEAAECDLIDRYLPASMPVIELGGCLGLVSSFIATRLAVAAKHIVVEANPALVEVCRANATLGGVRRNTEVVASAVAYGDKRVMFDVSDNVHVSHLTNGTTGVARMVDAVRLRDLVERLGRSESYALICDIEGAEADLIVEDAGALVTCGLVIMELHPDAYGAGGPTVDGLVAVIERAGLALVRQQGNVYAFQRAGGAGEGRIGA